MINITVCTPTYDRGNLLSKLYESLKKQKKVGFEWLIVDDGSSDDTEQIVRGFIEENIIDIRYIVKENGGKHTALNIAIDNAKGELFWIVDSDDYVIDEALEFLWSSWANIEKKEDFAGISGLRGYENGVVIGTSITKEYEDTDALSYRYKLKVQGDKAEVYKTEILKRFKFPEIGNERYVTESVVWNRIADKGLKLRYYNRIIYICEYLEGGLTNTSDKNIMDSWQGTTLYYKELLAYKQIPFKVKILNGCRAYLHYCYEKGIGFKGIYNITRNPIYVSAAFGVYGMKKIKRLLKRGEMAL